MRRRLLVALVLVTALLPAGCAVRTAGAPAGHAAAARAGLECSRRTTPQTVHCLTGSLSAFWTRTLAKPVRLHVVLDPAPAEVPRACRAALRLNSAFSCPVDDAVYLTAPFLHRLRSTGPALDTWVRIAATTGHEMGHIVQFAVHAPLLDVHHPSWAQSRAVEQQADCLAGVWSASVGIGTARYRAATAVVLHVVDSRWERRSHGAPAQRLEALARGQHARTPAGCGLHLAR